MAFALMLDALVGSVLALLVVWVLGIPPLPSFSLAVLWLGVSVLTLSVSWLGGTSSWGQWVHSRRSIPKKLLAVFLTFLCTGAALELFVLSHPLWRRVESVRLEPFTPSVEQSSDWEVLPFYYSLGAWPKRYQGKPVFFSVPYEKGPPERFLGHVVARWDLPQTELVFEGPKTPVAGLKPDRIAECLRDSWGILKPACRQIRQAFLLSSIELASDLHLSRWEIRWFLVDNPHMFPDEKPVGIHLRASGSDRVWERYVLITPKATAQAISLSSLPSETTASELLEKAIRAQRLSDELDTGRAWAEKALSKIRLSEVRKLARKPASSPDQFLDELSAVQRLLVSRISVDPRGLDAYFHLSGTSLWLVEEGLRARNPEWTAIAKPLIENTYRFARDIKPEDPRTLQMQNLWLDAKKL